MMLFGSHHSYALQVSSLWFSFMPVASLIGLMIAGSLKRSKRLHLSLR